MIFYRVPRHDVETRTFLPEIRAGLFALKENGPGCIRRGRQVWSDGAKEETHGGREIVCCR